MQATFGPLPPPPPPTGCVTEQATEGDLTMSQSKYKHTFTPQDLMYPRNRALEHPAAVDLMQYALDGCPVDCGRDWTIQEMELAIKMGRILVHKNQKQQQHAGAKHWSE